MIGRVEERKMLQSLLNEEEPQFVAVFGRRRIGKTYLVRESTQIERGVSMDELTRLWDKYNVPADKRLNMTRALKNLEEKRVLRQFTDETREVYRLNVDLFRRWWYVHHRDLTLEFSL